MNMSLTKIKSLLVNYFASKDREVNVISETGEPSGVTSNNAIEDTPISYEIDVDKIDVAFKWTGGYCSDDLDLFALVLNEDGQIAQVSDFVFYNSECRVKSVNERPLSYHAWRESGYRSPAQFRNVTYPSNSDGAVILDGDFAAYIESISGMNCEAAYIDLKKLDGEKVSSIELYVSNYHKEEAFKDVRSVSVDLYFGRTDSLLQSFSMNKFSKDDDRNMFFIGALTYSNELKKWTFRQSFRLQQIALGQLFDRYL